MKNFNSFQEAAAELGGKRELQSNWQSETCLVNQTEYVFWLCTKEHSKDGKLRLAGDYFFKLKK